MNYWPNTIRYQVNGSSCSVEPDVSRNVSVTGHTHQRVLTRNRDAIFNVSARMDGIQLTVFKQFLTDNPTWFIGPYFDCDYEQMGVLRIINNSYSTKPIKNDVFLVSWQCEVQNRSTEIGQTLFNLLSALNGDFGILKGMALTLEKAVNENNL